MSKFQSGFVQPMQNVRPKQMIQALGILPAILMIATMVRPSLGQEVVVYGENKKDEEVMMFEKNLPSVDELESILFQPGVRNRGLPEGFGQAAPGQRVKGFGESQSGTPTHKPAFRNSSAATQSRVVGFRINFDVNSFTIVSSSYPPLQRLAELMKRKRWLSRRLFVEGHTDGTGSETHNQWLSEQRAASVKRHLINLGIAPSRLITIGKGESEPLPAEDRNSRRNRRVQFRSSG